MTLVDQDAQSIQRALELARRGEGFVEPNPMVGCVIVQGTTVVGEGWHQRFGGPHAEVEALRAAGAAARGATAYVTLEPCCHQGKTPPCTEALIAAGIRRVVAAQQDPFPQVAGGGFRALRQAGIEVEVGVCEAEARQLNAPFLRLVEDGRPWVIAKWAMTLDGKLATQTGDSRWISNELSRASVHRLRGRVDAILIGSGTAGADDPLLTARPGGARVATRIVLDSAASLPLDSQLVRTVSAAPVMLVAAPDAPRENIERLVTAGCEVWTAEGASSAARIEQLLRELGRRHMTNLLVEGGSTVLGSFFAGGWIDEVWAYIAPKLIGGAAAASPIGGPGWPAMQDAAQLRNVTIEQFGDDVCVRGRVLLSPRGSDARA